MQDSIMEGAHTAPVRRPALLFTNNAIAFVIGSSLQLAVTHWIIFLENQFPRDAVPLVGLMTTGIAVVMFLVMMWQIMIAREVRDFALPFKVFGLGLAAFVATNASEFGVTAWPTWTVALLILFLPLVFAHLCRARCEAEEIKPPKYHELWLFFLMPPVASGVGFWYFLTDWVWDHTPYIIIASLFVAQIALALGLDWNINSERRKIKRAMKKRAREERRQERRKKRRR